MLKEIFSDMKYNKMFLIVNPLAVLFIYLICFIVSLTLSFVFVSTGDNEQFLYFGISSVYSLIILPLMEVILAVEYSMKFSLALSMGRTRKSFMSSYAIQAIINQIIAFAIIILLNKVEPIIYSLIFPQYVRAFEFTLTYDIWLVIVIILYHPVFCMFICTLLGRFGNMLITVLIGIFMAVLYIINASLVGVFQNNSIKIWISIGILAVVLMIATTLYLGKKQAVR